MTGTELELKMQFAPEILARLRRHPVLTRHRLGRAVTRIQHTLYFDTPDAALRGRGLVLRVRRIGPRHIMSVKTEGEQAFGLFRRRELEVAVAGDQPDLTILRQSEFGPELAAGDMLDSLQPVFMSEITRTAIQLGGEGWRAEIAFDRGSVQTLIGPGASSPISEVEIELQEGEPGILFELARELQAGLPARLLSESKSGRGYRLLSGAPASPSKARPVALSPDMTAAQCFQRIAGTCLQQLVANQPALIEARDPESIHQMRVALRRLRSATGLFKRLCATPEAARLKEQVRWLLGGLGPARDLDVFIAGFLDTVPDRLKGSAFERLRSHFAAAREDAYAVALARVEDPRFTSMVLAFGEWLERGDWTKRDNPALALNGTALAAQELERRHLRLLKAGRHLSRLSPADRHAFRIQVKRLRYAGEFFLPLYPEKRTRRAIKLLGEIQDALGGLNDIAVARETLRSTLDDRNDADLAWSAGLVAGYREADVDAGLADAAKSWREYRKLEKFWQQ